MDMVVTDLGVARGGVGVLDGVSFRLSAGEVLVLRGPNGVGKTTLLRTLAGLQPAVAGRMEMGEVAYGGHSDAVKAMLTVAENLEFWAAVHGVAGIEAALGAMDLAGLRDRRAADLSAGQRRRLGLARLLVTGREVWLLDEPTVSLDVASVGLFGAALRAHLGQGGSALIATHIDLGMPEARVLDLGAFKAVQPGLDEVFG
jgi:heme exporter protein A